MSHFTVLVIGENPEEQLQPFHEYECTGIKDEHVVFVPDEEYGFDKDLGIRGHWTNPNAKWDWYVLGGRWTGFFKKREPRVVQMAQGGPYGMHDVNSPRFNTGRPGVFGSPAKSGYCDQAKKMFIDFDGMRDEAGLEAQNTYEKVMKVIGHLPTNRKWDEVRESIKNIDKARQYYHSQIRIKALRSSEDDEIKYLEVDDFLISKEEYIENARNKAISTFAVIKDGKWYERGEMGWWGMVSNEMDQQEWNKQFSQLLDSISGHTLLSVYDCHI